MKSGALDVERLLDYELNSSLRYRRFVSLVLLSDQLGPLKASLLENVIRRSDELFLLDGYAAILMSETGRVGALRAIERYKEAYLDNGDLRFVVTSYPKDGSDRETLLQTARRRLERVKASGRGGVVSSG